MIKTSTSNFNKKIIVLEDLQFIGMDFKSNKRLKREACETFDSYRVGKSILRQP